MSDGGKKGFWWWAKENGAALLLLLVGGGLLAHRGVEVYRLDRWLRDHEPAAVTVTPDRVDPANEGRLVHVIAPLTHTPDVLTDPWSGTTADGFALLRRAAAYGGGTETNGSGWMVDVHRTAIGGTADANDPTRSAVWLPTATRVGAFTLDPAVIVHLIHEATGEKPAGFHRGDNLTPTGHMADQLHRASVRLPPVPAGTPPPGWRAGTDGRLYAGLTTDGAAARDGESGGIVPQRSGVFPAEGDRLVEYRRLTLPDGPVTLIARQRGDRLEPMPRGTDSFVFARFGDLDRPAAFAAARRGSATQVTVLAIVGASLCLAGLAILVFAHLDRFTSTTADR
jgi:hypothetical protein